MKPAETIEGTAAPGIPPSMLLQLDQSRRVAGCVGLVLVSSGDGSMKQSRDYFQRLILIIPTLKRLMQKCPHRYLNIVSLHHLCPRVDLKGAFAMIELCE